MRSIPKNTAVLVCAGIDQDVIPTLYFAHRAAQLSNGDVRVAIIFRDIGFPMDEKCRRFRDRFV
jgi:hypothetical protein